MKGQRKKPAHDVSKSERMRRNNQPKKGVIMEQLQILWEVAIKSHFVLLAGIFIAYFTLEGLFGHRG